mmetsp:Transcript_17640/g.43413  ORF Transcript_17640/g.43413 Transcript_17640/m.43413 type:complete len:372 (+) Transcript_17640:104-1219(+)
MATPHLSHLLPWNDLVELIREHDPSEVYLPVGKTCGKIHARTPELERMVGRRNSYIPEEQICRDYTNCIETEEFPSNFGKKKGKLLPFAIIGNCDGGVKVKTLRTKEQKIKLQRFVKAFSSTIQTFARQELEKLTTIATTPEYKRKMKKIATNAYVETCEKAFRGKFQGTRFDREYALMAESTPLSPGKKHNDDLAVLLYLDQIGQLNLSGALTEKYGGQAVGHGISFLMDYLVPFYVHCNLIAAADYLLEPEKWGYLKDGSFFRNQLKEDCDFYTFIPSWRTALKLEWDTDNENSGLLRDWPATMEILRKTFRLLVVCETLCQHKRLPNYRPYCISSESAIRWKIADSVGLRFGDEALFLDDDNDDEELE